MFSDGEVIANGFAMNGKYGVGPDSPPWGWKTVFELIDDGHLAIVAFNVSPDGQEAMAVEAKYIETEQRRVRSWRSAFLTGSSRSGA